MSLKDANVGDVVALQASHREPYQRATVDRVTPTRLEVGGLVYMRSSGRQLGYSSAYTGRRIEPWSSRHEERNAKLAEELAHAAWYSLSHEQASAVLALLGSFNKLETV